MPVTIRISEEGGAAAERAILDLEKSLENLQRATDQLQRSSTRASRALEENETAQASAEDAAERYAKALGGTVKESERASRAIEEAEAATRKLRDETTAATRSEDGRSRALSGAAVAVAKLVGVHLALHGAMSASKREGNAVSAAFGTVRRGVLGMSAATLGATAALNRLRDMTTEVGQRADRAMVPLRRLSDWLGNARRLTMLLAGAGGLILLTRSLLRIGEAAGNIVPVERAFDRLAGSVGTTGEALRTDLEDAVAGTVPRLKLMETGVLALNSGAIKSREDLLELAASARLLGRTTGIETSHAIHNLVRAIGTMNPVLLKSLGIVASVDEANREYAANLGVAVSKLDEAQRKEAFRIAVLNRVRAGVSRVADEEGLRSDRLDTLRRELATLDPISRQYESTLRAIAIETSRVAAGTDDMNTRMQRIRANFTNQANEVRVVVSENEQLVGVLADVENLTARGTRANLVFARSVDVMTTAVASMTRVAIGPVGQTLVVWMGFRAVWPILVRTTSAVTGLAAATATLGSRAVLARLAPLLGPKGLLLAGAAAAVLALRNMGAQTDETAREMSRAFRDLQASIDSLSMAAALREVERLQAAQRDAEGRVASLTAQSQVFGISKDDADRVRQELAEARVELAGLSEQVDLVTRRFVTLSREQSAALSQMKRLSDVSWDAWRRLTEAQKRGKDGVRDIRDEIIVLQQEMLALEAGTDEFDAAAEAMARLNDRLGSAERNLRAIGQLAEGVGRQLLQAFEGVDPSRLSLATTSVTFPEPDERRLSHGERAMAARERLMQPLTGGSTMGREARAEAEIASVTAALQSMAVVGNVSESVLAVVRARLAELGVTAEHIDQVLGQFSGNAQAKVEQMQATSVAAFGAMAQAAIRGSNQMAESVINAFTQILQAQAMMSGNFLGGALIGAIGGIFSAIAGRNRRETQPVKVESFSRDAERSLERAQDKTPQIVRVSLIAPNTGEILETIEQEQYRRAGRDANTRPIVIPFRIGAGT